MPMKDENSIKALIQLIDDPDEHIFVHVRDTLLSYGHDAIPFLENSWEHDHYDLIFQSRVEQIINEIQFEETKTQLLQWCNSDNKDLLRGALIIAHYQYPSLDDSEVHEVIQAIRKDIWLEINNTQTGFEKIKILNHIFFEKYNFQGDTKQFHAADNSCINRVLETRKGNPLSLSVIYSIVAQSLDIPLYGVNLPNHFILAYMDELGTNALTCNPNKWGVLFYVNPFTKGSLLDENEIREFIDRLQLVHTREYYEPCSNSAVLKRMLSNLISSFQSAGNAEKVKQLQELRRMIP
jgi:regulator of sirC expression with transglutaminase-like and TPR domain